MFLLQMVLVNAVVFAGLVVVLRRLMAKHATTATAHLQGLSQDYLRKQEELKKRLEEAERHYQEQLVKAQEEAYRLKEQALKEGEAAKQQAVDQARQEAERIIQQANQARETLRKEMIESMEVRAVERACELLRRVLPESLREAAHARWMEELMTNGLINLGQLERREDVREARATSAFPLTAAQRKQLMERLQAALGTSITLQETVEPGMIAGLIVTIGHLVLDGSLSSRLLEAARHAQDTSR